RCLPRAAERRVTAWGRIVAFRSAKGRLAADGRMTFRGAKGDNPAPQGDSIMNRKSSIYVAGGDTLIGRALIERLSGEGARLVGLPPCEPDPTSAEDAADFFARTRPEYVFVAAGATGGIRENQRRPADLMRDNLLSAVHLIDQAARNGVKKLLYLASSCAYPKHASQPL